MQTNEIRWKQRFENYRNAHKQFKLALNLAKVRPLSSLEQQGLIQAFEFTQEMAWKVLQDYLKHQGITGLTGSRDTFRMAFQNNLILEGELWLDTILTRNLTSHLYDNAVLEEIFLKVTNQYPVLFEQLEQSLNNLI
jgi:nucleotidyltransferase substrate binding protein (TIGR01987 family)